MREWRDLKEKKRQKGTFTECLYRLVSKRMQKNPGKEHKKRSEYEKEEEYVEFRRRIHKQIR